MRKQEIDQQLERIRTTMYSSAKLRRGPFSEQWNLFERVYGTYDKPDYIPVIVKLTDDEVEYCKQRGVDV